MNRSPTARAPDEPPAALEDLGDPRSDALVDAHGTGYQSFRTTLRPRWLRVWADILLGYLALALVAGGSLAASGLAWPWQCAVALACAAAFGYWMAYLQLFLHEAAHFNIAASRRWNDRLANLLVAGWTGTTIAAYRIIHWEHHRFHGQPNDAEHSYFAALDRRFIVESLTGVAAWRVLRSRGARLRSSAPRLAAHAGRGLRAWTLLLHATVLGAALLTRHPWTALAWLLGIGVFFPFFGALRQLLEHRSVDARAAVDYAVVPHGATTRSFHEGPVGSTFGAAGFTRHLLHHWDPALSYTNLAAVEQFLRGCAAIAPQALRKTTYWRAFRALYGRP